jgi:hypothetical protein
MNMGRTDSKSSLEHSVATIRVRVDKMGLCAAKPAPRDRVGTPGLESPCYGSKSP